ncbi:SDR family oxidoreductase, partial [Kitasatospora sp. Root107]|uniref:SDR family oxidoreductase n=1 Tax=Kitasatospora sp. Root107 TaxID=1736424 RepID=UPI00351653F2
VVARWLAEAGAGRIVLGGRSGPSPEAAKEIAEIRELGCDVRVLTGDLAVEGVAERLVAEVRRDDVPLCGVVHAAGVLADRLALDIEEQDLRTAWSAKADGAWQLHRATADRTGGEPDWWLAFSSAAATLGSPGQLAYAAANSWLDELTTWRRAQGLPGTSINWGTWAEVGGAADGGRIDVLRPILPAEGIEALHAVLAGGHPAAGVFALRPGAVTAFPELVNRPYFSELSAATAPSGTARWDGTGSLAEALRERVSALVGRPLDPAVPLLQAGLDSLAAMRIKSVLEHDFGVTVPARLLLRGASLADLEAYIAAGAEVPAPRWAEPAPTVRSGDEQQTGPLRVLQAGGTRSPLYLAHPGGGDSSVYRELAARLGPDQPCFGLDRIDGVDGVAGHAARYAELVDTPARLGGWSFGGVLAFETVRLLAARGRPTGTLVLIDSGDRHAGPDRLRLRP